MSGKKIIEGLEEAARLGAPPLCPDTIQVCIEALPDAEVLRGDPWSAGWCGAIDRSRAALEALLPKPDPAKALVEEWQAECPIPLGQYGPATLEPFARWLIQSGKIEVKG